jgi:DNA/RNA endonuclease YhcR with UshA esterase domain
VIVITAGSEREGHTFIMKFELYPRREVPMKSLRIITLILAAAALVLTTASTAMAQKPEAGAQVPKYDLAAEATFKGTVQEVRTRQCPVSGGMGSHLILKLSGGNSIEVHLASTKFVETYDLVFNKGDAVTVVGTNVQFEGVETIFARTVLRGSETYLFRDKKGLPAW